MMEEFKKIFLLGIGAASMTYEKSMEIINDMVEKTQENKEERYLIISLVYQTFFLLYGITGTCLYEAPTLVPYVIFCSITEHYWSKKYLNK